MFFQLLSGRGPDAVERARVGCGHRSGLDSETSARWFRLATSIRRACLLAGLLVLCSSAWAQQQGEDAPDQGDPTDGHPDFAVPFYAEYAKKIASAERVDPLTDSMFGDNYSPYHGQVEFDNVDIDIPGNNALPVQMRRRFAVQPLWSGQGYDPNTGGPGNPYGGMGNFDARERFEKALELEAPLSRSPRREVPQVQARMQRARMPRAVSFNPQGQVQCNS